MQQMTSMLLNNSSTNTTSSAKVSSQESNNDDFSLALASVNANSYSLSSPKSAADSRVVTSSRDSHQEALTAEKEVEDGADINLIFAQIGMANEMKKSADGGQSLPLSANGESLGEVDSLSRSELAFEHQQENSLSDESDLALEDSETAGLDESVDVAIGTDLGTDVALDDNSDESMVLANTQDHFAEKLGMQEALDAKAKRQAEQLTPIDPNSLDAKSKAGIGNLGVMPIETTIDSAGTPNGMNDGSLKSVSAEQTLAEAKSVQQAMDQTAQLTQDAEVHNQAAIKASDFPSNGMVQTGVSAQGANATNVNVISAVTSQLNTLGTSAALANSTKSGEVTDGDLLVPAEASSRNQATAESLLKEAKLTVALDTAPGASFIAQEEGETPEIKSTHSVQSLSTPTSQRLDVAPIQLSLRQAVEQQNQMQDMIQRFSPVMKQQLITMVSQGVQQAEIRLDPPELGHMLVKIQVHGDQTQVQFHVTQSQTRDLVEQAIPRLRELLQEQGMQLADSQVSQGDQGKRQGGDFGEGGGSSGSHVDEIPADSDYLGQEQATSLTSGIDYYA